MLVLVLSEHLQGQEPDTGHRRTTNQGGHTIVLPPALFVQPDAVSLRQRPPSDADFDEPLADIAPAQPPGHPHVAVPEHAWHPQRLLRGHDAAAAVLLQHDAAVDGQQRVQLDADPVDARPVGAL